MNLSANVMEDFKQVKILQWILSRLWPVPLLQVSAKGKRNLNLSLESKLFNPKIGLQLHHCLETA